MSRCFKNLLLSWVHYNAQSCLLTQICIASCPLNNRSTYKENPVIYKKNEYLAPSADQHILRYNMLPYPAPKKCALWSLLTHYYSIQAIQKAVPVTTAITTSPRPTNPFCPQIFTLLSISIVHYIAPLDYTVASFRNYFVQVSNSAMFVCSHPSVVHTLEYSPFSCSQIPHLSTVLFTYQNILFIKIDA